MTSVSPNPSATAPVSPALSAFLRGIERRAFVFVQVQCGQDDEAEAALGRALRAFVQVSGLSPLSAWPAAFWALLMAQAELAEGASEVPELSALSSGPRAALLLRMVAGLDFPHAAQVLGVSEQTYRFALQRALQQLGDAGISYAVLGALRERLHRQVKTLPESRVESLAALRARVLQGQADEAPPPALAPRSPWLQRLPWVALVVLALGFAATFWSPTPPLAPGSTEGLPMEPAPAPVPLAGDSDVVTHPDYTQLASPGDEALAGELALLSWVASGEAGLPETPSPAAEADTTAPPVAAPAPSMPAAGPETETAPVEPEAADAR